MRNIAKLLILIAGVTVIVVAVGSGLSLFPKNNLLVPTTTQKIVTEESVITDVVEKASPSVVTVSAQLPARRVTQFNPFGGFSSGMEGGQPQDIGTGFVVSADGLIITNKHVVSDTNATFKVINKDGKEFQVEKISRDPSNDIAVIKINTNGVKLTPLELGDSSNLKWGKWQSQSEPLLVSSEKLSQQE
jgi:serine protease Do